MNKNVFILVEGDFRNEESKEGFFNVVEQLKFDILNCQEGNTPETEIVRLYGPFSKYKILKTFFDYKFDIEGSIKEISTHKISANVCNPEDVAKKTRQAHFQAIAKDKDKK